MENISDGKFEVVDKNKLADEMKEITSGQRLVFRLYNFNHFSHCVFRPICSRCRGNHHLENNLRTRRSNFKRIYCLS